MSGLNGLELLKKMKDFNRFVRTIIMTGFLIEDVRFQQYAKKKIIDAFLQKPIKIHDLLTEVNTQLHSYEMQKCYASHDH
jgi:FixJ family two-component response regulator